MTRPFGTDRPTVVCARLGDPWSVAVPGSVAARCDACGHEVSVSPIRALKAGAESLAIVCVQCFAAYRDAGNPVVLWHEGDPPPSPGA